MLSHKVQQHCRLPVSIKVVKQPIISNPIIAHYVSNTSSVKPFEFQLSSAPGSKFYTSPTKLHVVKNSSIKTQARNAPLFSIPPPENLGLKCSTSISRNFSVKPPGSEHSTQASQARQSESPASAADNNPTLKQLRLVLITSCIPFIGFGFVDNFFMIILGELVDNTFCVRLGLSTMTGAAIGNLASDIMGIKLGEAIEVRANRLKSLQPNLTNAQITMRTTRRYYYGGCMIGMTIGCILGMIPLLFLDTMEAERRKNNKAQAALFGQFAKELANCLEAESVKLYIVEKSPKCLIPEVQDEDMSLAGNEQKFSPATKTIDSTTSYDGQVSDPLASKKIYNSIFECSMFRPIFKQRRRCVCKKSSCCQVPATFVTRDHDTGDRLEFKISDGLPGEVFASKKVSVAEVIPFKVVSYTPHTAATPTINELINPPLFPWWPFDRVDSIDFKGELQDKIMADTASGKLAGQSIGAPVFGANVNFNTLAKKLCSGGCYWSR